MRSRFALAWHAVSVAMALFFASALVVLEPFHLNEGLADRGRELFYKVAAFAYPTGPSSPKIAVVTMSDASLAGKPWPPPFVFHATALQEIAARHPKAIFVDMAMIDERPDPTFGFFLQTLEAISRDTPVYMAAAPGRSAANSALPDLVELAKRDPRFRLVGVQLGEELGAERAYELADPSGFRPAAIALYEDLNPRLPRPRAHAADEEMDVWWAAPRSRFNCRDEARAHACAMIGQGVVRRLLTLLAIGVLPVFPDQEDLSKVDVPYAPSMDVLDVKNGDASNVVDPALQDAVVFYGADVALASDHVETPIQASVAGVNVHAMAYDNLVAMRGRFIGVRPPFGLGEREHTLLLIVILAFATLVARWTLTLCLPRLALQPHLREEKQFRMLDALVLVPLGVIISIFEFKVLRVGPGVWASVLVATITGDLLAARWLASAVVVRLLRRTTTARLAVRRKPRWRR